MKQLRLLIPALILLFAAACGNSTVYNTADFNVEIYAPSYASGFDIRGTERNDATLITVRNPWQGAGNVEQYLLVLREGAKAPVNFNGQFIKAPVQRVVCMSSSHVAMFDAIGQVRRVSGVSGIEYISNEYVNEHSHCGEVRDVGYDTNINFELLTAMKPDLMLLYGVTGENTIITGKLRELCIPYIYIGDYMEESPLGKAEWLVAVAELCNMREQGTETFGEIAERYNAIKASVARVAPPVRRKVMLNTPYRDTWFMPSSRSFMIRLVEDAGGEYIYRKNNSDTSVALDMEEAYLLATTADVWLNVGACNTLAELTAQNPKFAKVPSVRNRMVFNNNHRQTPAGGSDFWESGVIRPDLVLRDLSAILRPGDTEAEDLYYYKRLE
ncbi:ABC transporter substrate-binding protein [uncultured Alistipes sp.]|jgi:ABC-type fe3+-hydroxamate transport system, periplasmic component|uniref:ABC transporter substrate-binding protein n=1 Tax=uncultured Alistipes sp. TaxID=538949 RepID=UPI0025EE245E|nr:ABC transporter substrate-binding protein [uncultured Alistipes sp.]